jgi:predicted ATPase
MKLAICGAHRTGKTTLLNALDINIPVVQTQTSKVFLDNGLDPAGDYEFGVKLAIQHKILAHYQAAYAAAGESFITDRSPIDALAYTLAAVNNTTPDKYSSRLREYADMCIAEMKQFSKVFVLPPVIPLVHADNKGALTQSFIYNIHATILGLLVHHNIEFDIVPHCYHTVAQRIDFIKSQL